MNASICVHPRVDNTLSVGRFSPTHRSISLRNRGKNDVEVLPGARMVSELMTIKCHLKAVKATSPR